MTKEFCSITVVFTLMGATYILAVQIVCEIVVCCHTMLIKSSTRTTYKNYKNKRLTSDVRKKNLSASSVMLPWQSPILRNQPSLAPVTQIFDVATVIQRHAVWRPLPHAYSSPSCSAYPASGQCLFSRWWAACVEVGSLAVRMHTQISDFNMALNLAICHQLLIQGKPKPLPTCLYSSFFPALPPLVPDN